MENQTFNMTAVFLCEDLKSEMREFFEDLKQDFEYFDTRSSFCSASGSFEMLWHSLIWADDAPFKCFVRVTARLFLSKASNMSNWQVTPISNPDLFEYHKKLGWTTYPSHSLNRKIRLKFLDFILKHFDQLFTFNENTVTVNTNLITNLQNNNE